MLGEVAQMSSLALHLVTTAKQELDQVASIIAQCPSAWIDVLHIREKHRSARELLLWYMTLQALLPQTRIYINDRLDVAAAVHAPGVQLGYSSLPLPLARGFLSAQTVIGCSAHSIAETVQAHKDGADYVIYGHIYPSSSKAGLAPKGVAALAQVVAASPLPVIAIGGMEPAKVGEVMATGCAGIAVLSAFFLHPAPVEQLKRFREELDDDTTPNQRRM
jgi:thiazole tautomerase (transcriptional regulator TenI)